MTLDWQQLFTWLWWWLLTKCQSPLLTTVLLNFSKFDKLKIELSAIWRKLRITLENHFFIYLACNQSLYFRLSWFTFALWDNLWFCFSFIQYKPGNVFGMVCPCCRGTIWCSTSLIFFFVWPNSLITPAIYLFFSLICTSWQGGAFHWQFLPWKITINIIKSQK